MRIDHRRHPVPERANGSLPRDAEAIECRLEHCLTLGEVARDRDEVRPLRHREGGRPLDQPERRRAAGVQIRQQRDAQPLQPRRQPPDVDAPAPQLEPARLHPPRALQARVTLGQRQLADHFANAHRHENIASIAFIRLVADPIRLDRRLRPDDHHAASRIDGVLDEKELRSLAVHAGDFNAMRPLHHREPGLAGLQSEQPVEAGTHQTEAATAVGGRRGNAPCRPRADPDRHSSHSIPADVFA